LVDHRDTSVLLLPRLCAPRMAPSRPLKADNRMLTQLIRSQHWRSRGLYCAGRVGDCSASTMGIHVCHGVSVLPFVDQRGASYRRLTCVPLGRGASRSPG
jgi:hypothetical protein